MTMFKYNIFVVTLLLLTLGACSPKAQNASRENNDQDNSILKVEKDLISIQSIGLTPEGITVNPLNGNFIVSSVGNGNLVEVDMDGNYSVFADAPELISTLGTHIDPSGKYVVTAIADIGFSQRSVKEKFSQVSSIAIFELKSKKLIEVIDFTELIPEGKHFANDFTWDSKGNLYVTDSYVGAIYKVNPQYEASVFLKDPTFTLRNPYSFGVNGIVFDKKANSLLVAKLDEGKIFKVELENPKSFSEIKLENPIPIDGMLLNKNNELLVVSSINTSQDNETSSKVYKLGTTDDWTSAKIINTFDTKRPSATTLTERNNAVYTVHAYYFGKQPVQEFHIQKVNFK